MRPIICVFIMLALVGMTGCAKKDAAPVDQPEATIEAQPISTEDFESGDAEGVVEGGEDAANETEDDGGH